MAQSPSYNFLLILLLFGAVVASTGCDNQTKQTAEAIADTSQAQLFPVPEDGAWGYIDTSGSVVIDPQFRRAFNFSDGLALVETDSGFGYIRHDGSYAIEPQFEEAWHFSDDVAPVQTEGEWGFVNKNGGAVVDREFDFDPQGVRELDYQPRNLELMRENDQYGYRDESGEVVIDPQFKNAWYFSDGMARVKVDSLWGFIDRSGEVVIEPRYDLAWDFTNGLALVKVDGKYGYIDRSGEYVWQPSR